MITIFTHKTVFFTSFVFFSQRILWHKQLGDPAEHRFMNSNDDALDRIASGGFKSMWDEMYQCMEVVGFSQAEKDSLFSILSGILHLGDVEFEGDEEAHVSSSGGRTRAPGGLPTGPGGPWRGGRRRTTTSPTRRWASTTRPFRARSCSATTVRV